MLHVIKFRNSLIYIHHNLLRRASMYEPMFLLNPTTSLVHTIKPQRAELLQQQRRSKMAAFVSRKKTRLSRKAQADELGFCCSFFDKLLLRVPAAVFILVFIYIWSSSTSVISGNILHVCVSSRKLNNLYCLSAGAQPSFQIPVSLVNGSSSADNGEEVAVPGISSSASNIRGEEEGGDVRETNDSGSKSLILAVNETVDYAYRDVKQQLQLHRSWVSSSNPAAATCEGRGIFVYELPSKFNKDLLAQCSGMIPWVDFCKYLSNDGLGEAIPSLGRGWYNTHQYALEPIFHTRVMKHPCRVYDPSEAGLFYVPYYGGLDVLRWHFKNASDDAKDSLAIELVRWLESQGSWYKNLGKDHVFVLGKISWDFRRNEGGWGTRLLELDEMQNPIKLLIERHPWHANDVGIPHPTYFHPHTDDDIVSWQLKLIKSSRRNVVSFAGADRPDAPESIRSILIEQCSSTSNGGCKFLNCTSGQCDRPESIIEVFTESEFCLQPPGDSPTRKSVFDSLISGCIPVLFDPMTAYYQYPWNLPEDGEKYSVFIDKEEVRNKSVNVVEKLMKISTKERENMRRYIVYELLPGLVYGDLDSKFDKLQDAFSIAINSLLERVSRLNSL